MRSMLRYTETPSSLHGNTYSLSPQSYTQCNLFRVPTFLRRPLQGVGAFEKEIRKTEERHLVHPKGLHSRYLWPRAHYFILRLSLLDACRLMPSNPKRSNASRSSGGLDDPYGADLRLFGPGHNHD